jgi:hypothetical protein
VGYLAINPEVYYRLGYGEPSISRERLGTHLQAGDDARQTRRFLQALHLLLDRPRELPQRAARRTGLSYVAKLTLSTETTGVRTGRVTFSCTYRGVEHVGDGFDLVDGAHAGEHGFVQRVHVGARAGG